MFWLLAILAYLLGSLSFAILLSHLAGLGDPRAAGSGNPGATNMLRVAGKKLALLTLLGDLSKGLLPVAVAWCAGFGRLGGIGGPMLGSLLISTGMKLDSIFYVLAGIGLFGVLLTLLVPMSRSAAGR